MPDCWVNLRKKNSIVSQQSFAKFRKCWAQFATYAKVDYLSTLNFYLHKYAKKYYVSVKSRKDTCEVLYPNAVYYASWNSSSRDLPQPAGQILSEAAEIIARI